MEQQALIKAKQWLSSKNLDDAARKEVEAMVASTDKSQLIECFYRDLEFGTGGLRGIMGTGSNRINKYTIGMATQGLANYLKKTYPGKQVKVAIAHDSRNNSPFFAQTTADVFSANGFKVYFFDALRPTPELSFAIRHLGCQSGVVITASHNPKEYNGYKAYWNDGAQMIAPHDKNTITEVGNIKSIDDVKFAPNNSLIEKISKEVDEPYLEAIKAGSLSPDIIKRQKDLKIVFSPIHGTGITLVPEILKRMGFENVTIVDEQATPDGNFPTVVYPNPEEAEAMSIALKKAKAIDADLVMATDPDADRVGIAVKNDKGEFQLLNGNQTGALLVYYLLEQWKNNGKLDGKQFVVKTIVTTDLIGKIADGYKVKCYETLTGFKFIAALIRELEGKETFIGGGEESYGYLIGDAVRDKDAIASCAFIAEMTAFAKDKGMSLFQMLNEMYLKFGYYKEHLISLTKKGIKGQEEIKQMMDDLRANPPKTINGSKLLKLADYTLLEERDFVTGKTSKLDYPKSDVMQFFTEDGSKISARPSGTEPKIKFYFSVTTPVKNAEELKNAEGLLMKRIDGIIADMKLK
ncbi:MULTISPECIES: phospho-sugar mutase [unclassified Imperialibacter]|uniref:phospho-sugar mutase n=1 Tax=unclassified Imperialibacter TaxID=2629706 RepID=UPI001250DF0F|nr:MULTISPECIES: phospho-sugar mutase [unclassified Imperialibacter]CAD5267772.1 Phosphoglucomutase [Imperialibacter sp. 75]CAD5280243.1 Phosphoglucomutase [Imperialibacter sp. 89]VVT01335.1 Phosphoglucomutase [Imperialibacter sp. EC-SDR9]